MAALAALAFDTVSSAASAATSELKSGPFFLFSRVESTASTDGTPAPRRSLSVSLRAALMADCTNGGIGGGGRHSVS